MSRRKPRVELASPDTILTPSAETGAKLRSTIANLFQISNLGGGGQFPVTRLQTSAKFSTEQIWGQLHVAYAGFLSEFSSSLDKFAESGVDQPAHAIAPPQDGLTISDDDNDNDDDVDDSPEDVVDRFNPFVAEGDETDETLSNDEEDAEDRAARAEMYGDGTLFEKDEKFEDLEETPDDFAEEDRKSNEENEPNRTPFESRDQERRNHVRDLEEQRVFGQKWTMQGEVSGAMRPRDSLVDEMLSFDHGARVAPVITDVVTSKLEDRIKKRILEKNFDDVQRRTERTTSRDLETVKRDVDADSKKSKLSLVDLYEKEFLEKKKLADDQESTEKHAEPLTEIEKDELKAIQMFKRLAQHLDALSNFYFTPLPVHDDASARVRATQQRAPAIAVESVGMLAKTAEAALAPQDYHRPMESTRSGPIGHSEKSPRELQAHRRAQKERGRGGKSAKPVKAKK